MFTTQQLKNCLAATLVAGLAACGGAPKGTVATGGKVPPPPSVLDGGKKEVRNISKDARKDYREAVEYYKEQQKAGWSKSSCESSASKFRSVGADHSLIEGYYMAGRSFQNCGMDAEAEGAYQEAVKVKAHAQSTSNLGEIYFRAGKVDAAKKYWETAVRADPKLTGARNNLAFLMLQELRNTKPGKGWNDLEKSTRDQLSSVLAVDNENATAYVIYGLVYMEGAEKNKSRLDLAKLLLDEGAKLQADSAALQNAYGLLQLLKNNQGDALARFLRAVEMDPKFNEARMNVGSITLGFRKYDLAKEQYQAVLERDGNNYDALNGLGIALRGLKDLDGAEDAYKRAQKLDDKRGAAYFNLGVLYKDFRANSASEIKASQAAYKTARDYFNQYLSKADATNEGKADAKDNISDCDKIIKQLDEVIAATAAGG